MNMKIRHDPPVPPVSKSFESHANDEEERRRLPPRWPHKSGEKQPPAKAKKADVGSTHAEADDVKSKPTVIYTKTPKGKIVLKTIPDQEGQSLDLKA